MNIPIATEGEVGEQVVECLTRLCETLRMHDERAAKMQELEVVMVTNEASMLKMQEETQRDLRELTANVREMSAVLNSHEELIRTNSTLVKELADIVKWLTTEQTKYRQSQSGMLWKILVAVLGSLNVLLGALIVRGY